MNNFGCGMLIKLIRRKCFVITFSALFVTVISVYYLVDFNKTYKTILHNNCSSILDKNYFRLDDQIQFRKCYNNVEYIGLPFSKEWNKYLQNFGLLNVDDINKSYILASEPVYVAAFSDNHYNEAKSMLDYLSQWYNGTKILYLYDLGLRDNNRKELIEKYNSIIIDLRAFPFGMYPDYVKKLDSYRWKPLIIAQMLSERPSIWWIDTSSKLKGQIRAVYTDFKDCSILNLHLCRYYPWVTVDSGGHSIFAATEPAMYNYLPLPESLSKTLTMFGANIQLIYGIKTVKEDVLKFWVLCALEPGCMAPKGAKLSCVFKNGYTNYADCHRFDQSAVNILLAWANDFQESAYHHNADNAFIVERFR